MLLQCSVDSRAIVETAVRENRMRCVLVATGGYPIEEFRYAAPDECLADLQDVESIFALLTGI